MKKTLKSWQIYGFLFTCVAGTLLHFLYDWTNQSVAAALFSAVNESTWEHMKLLFFSMFVFALIENRVIGKKYKNFMCAKLIGILTGLALIPVIFYTYTGIFGVSSDWFNILTFFISAAAAYFSETLILKRNLLHCKSQSGAIAALCLIAVVFFVFTFVRPEIPLFEDPVAAHSSSICFFRK